MSGSMWSDGGKTRSQTSLFAYALLFKVDLLLETEEHARKTLDGEIVYVAGAPAIKRER